MTAAPFAKEPEKEPRFLSGVLALCKVHPDEEARAVTMFFYLLAAVSAFIVGRISRDTLFLELPRAKELLPYMYVGIAVGVSFSVALYSRLERHFSRDQVTSVALAMFVALALGCRVLVEHGPDYYWLYYIWVDIFGTVSVIQCWSIASELFNAREAKRVFAFIGGGGVLANILCGALVKGLAPLIGSRNLIYLVAAMIALALFFQRRLCRIIARTPLLTAPAAKSQKSAVTSAVRPSLLRSRHALLIAVIVALTFFVSTVVDYQFKLVSGEAIPNSAERAAFFGSFFALTGVLAALVQFGATSRLLQRFGVLVALLLLPSFMLLGSSLLLIWPGLWAAVWVKGSENVLRYTVNDATMQLVYVPLPGALRARAKSAIDGILKPCAIGFSGLFLLLVAKQVSVTHLSYFTGSALFLWTSLLFFLRREYVRTLMSTLRKRRLDLEGSRLNLSDESTSEGLLRTLASPDDGEVIHALELMSTIEVKRTKLRQAVLQLLARSSSAEHHGSEQNNTAIRLAALRYLMQNGDFSDAPTLLTSTSDENETVRAQAARAVAKLGGEKATRLLEPLLKDSSLVVRAATVVGMISHGGIDGILRSAELLKGMLGGESAAEREQAAYILGEVRVATFYQPLLDLLADPESRVRNAAAIAAGKVKSPELIPPLVAALDDALVSAQAALALKHYGTIAAASLLEALKAENTPLSVRLRLPDILAELGAEAAAMALLDELPNSSGVYRAALVRGLSKLALASERELAVDRPMVSALVKEELADYYRWLVIRHDLALTKDDVLLGDAIESRMKRSLDRALRLFGLIYPQQTLLTVIDNLRAASAAARANAVEILDNLLEAEHKRWLIPIVEQGPAAEPLRAAVSLFPLVHRPGEEWLLELLASPDPWLVVVALEATRRRSVHNRTTFESKLSDDNPLIRETATWAMATQQSHAVSNGAL